MRAGSPLDNLVEGLLAELESSEPSDPPVDGVGYPIHVAVALERRRVGTLCAVEDVAGRGPSATAGRRTGRSSPWRALARC